MANDWINLGRNETKDFNGIWMEPNQDLEKSQTWPEQNPIKTETGPLTDPNWTLMKDFPGDL
jgi:hypothetical protein